MRYLKYILLPIACLLFWGSSNASDITEFDVDGIKVIHKPSQKEVISLYLVIKGGTANYPIEKEGVEFASFYMAMNGGTESMDKIAFKSAAEKIGTSFGSSASYDYGEMHMSCLKMFWDESWNLFSDAVMNPAMSEEEFAIGKNQMMSMVMSNSSDPDNHLRNIAMKHVFEGMNYEKSTEGTPESVEAMTLEDLKSYYAEAVVKNKAFIVVVGDIDQADLKKKIAESFGSMPMGKAATKEDPLVINKSSVYVEDRDIATNYIRGVMNGPAASSKEAVVMRMAMGILRDRYFKELRTKRSLTYAPAAFYAYSVVNNPYNVIYASTQKPQECMQVMVEEIDKIKEEGFSQKELDDKQQTFLTYHYMGLEESSSQAMQLVYGELAGDWSATERFTSDVNNIDLETLNAVFNKYTRYIKWTYLGKEADVTMEDFPQVEAVKSGRPH